MENELRSGGINTLVLRVDYNYKYKSHPELRNENTLSEKDVKKIVKAAKTSNIKLIPQINLLGHQSWASDLEKSGDYCWKGGDAVGRRSRHHDH